MNEIERLAKERDELWMLLDNIDTLDDACREHDDAFREMSRKHLRKRFEIHNPDASPATYDPHPWPDRMLNLPKVLLELPTWRRLRVWWLYPSNVHSTWRGALERGLEKFK